MTVCTSVLFAGPRTLALLASLICPVVVSAQRQAVLGDQPDLSGAHRAIQARDWPAAERNLRGLILLHPQSAAPHFLLGYVFFQGGRARDSLAEYTAGAAFQTPSADDLVTVASDYILLKDYGDAERWLLKATQDAPANAKAWYLLGRTQFKLDHASEAAASFRKCLQLQPADLPAQYNLGLALQKLDQPAEAEAAFRKAILLQQASGVADPQPYLNLGTLLLSQHHNTEALDQLKQAASLGPGNPMVYQQLGLALEALGRNAEAAVALERAVALAPQAEQPHFFLGRVYRRLGRTADASAEFEAVQHIYGSQSNKETPNDAPAPGIAR